MVGSFGPSEYFLFHSASKLARHKGIPRVWNQRNSYVGWYFIAISFQIYIACSSGARIGIAEEVKSLFRIAWEDPENKEKGFKYLYLTPEDYETVKDSLRVTMMEENEEKRFVFNISVSLSVTKMHKTIPVTSNFTTSEW